MWKPLVVALLLASVLLGQDHVHTDRSNAKLLPLPKSKEVFHFVIYGDRTGGPKEGIKVLEQAVKDTNLLDPDLVMTVGDLVQGYNITAEWMKEMREFQGVMNKLKMPWFPVAGNHDIYWRGKGKRPKGQHERSYETHFGPLWYAFEHKRCWFVVLFSDEGNPETGEKTFKKPASQRMSPAQFRWLQETLKKAKGADHVFLFLHHPRWRKGGYGDDWDKVHRELVAAGNVTAVFAGHIHQMTYREPDGIQYYTLATTGGSLGKDMPAGAGFLHHQNLVSVRKDKITVSTIPVGAVMDPKLLTEQVNKDMYAIRKDLRPRFSKPLALGAGGSSDGLYAVAISNPVDAPLELTIICESKDLRFRFQPDHRHLKLAPRATQQVMFHVRREGSGIDNWFRLPRVVVKGDYLAKASGLRLALTEKSAEVPVLPPVLGARPEQPNGHLALLARRAWLELAADRLRFGEGPFTVEAFVKLPKLDGRRVLFSHAGGQDFELYVDDGRPAFRLGRQGRSLRAKSDDISLKAGTWHHLAGVWDGGTAYLYLDGANVARTQGPRDTVAGDLRIGAGSDNKRQANDFLGGLLDEVRISSTARYRGGFQPPARLQGFRADSHTLLLLHLDQDLGPWVADRSRNGAHPRRRGSARCVRD